MANGVKTYQIQIDGVSKSIKDVDILINKLREAENILKRVSSLKVNVSSGGGGGSSSSLNATSKATASVEEQINKIIKEQLTTISKINAAQTEQFQTLQKIKEEYKKELADAKAVGAQERLNADQYTHTMVGLKQKLADIKQVIQTTVYDEPEGQSIIENLTREANELTTRLKTMEEAYGQFGRNVGNYSSAFKDLQKVKVEVGGVTREFDNATQASRTLTKELRALQINGKGNTNQANELRKAINRLNSEIKDATVSCKAMDEAMDFMQSFTAMASIGQGFSALFGIDDQEITRSMQKLLALQNMLKGIEEIRRMMATEEGFGKILARSNDAIDKFTNKLFNAQKRMGVFVAGTKEASLWANRFANVLKFASPVAWIAAINAAFVAVEKITSALKDWAKGDADLVKSIDIVNVEIDATNKVLEKKLELIKKASDANLITEEQARVQTEMAYARAIAETNKLLKEREDLIRKQGIKGTEGSSSELYLNSSIGDKGVTTFGGIKNGIKDINDFIGRWDYLEKRVVEGKDVFDGFWSGLISSASDARDEFNHLNKLVANDFINAFYKMADGTREGTKRLVEYIDQMDKLTSGRYSKAMQLIKVDNETLQKELDNAWAMIQTLRDKVFQNPITVRLELNAKIESELDRLDPTRVMQRNIDKWTETLVLGVDDAGNKLTKQQKDNIEKIVKEQRKALDKAKKQRADGERNSAKKIANEIERAEKELNELRIQNMKEGLDKELAQIKEEWRQKLQAAKINGIKYKELEAEINKLYNKKIEDATRDHAAEMNRIYAEMWEDIYRKSDETFRMNSDTELTRLDNELDRYKRYLTERNSLISSFNPRYASYGGTKFNNNVSNNILRDLGYDIMATDGQKGDDERIKKAKEYLDLLEEINLNSIHVTKFNDSDDNEGWKEARKNLEDWLKENKETTESMNEMWETQELIQNGYTKSLSNAYKIRIREASVYFANVERAEKEHSEKVMKNELALLKNEEKTEAREEQGRYADQLARMDENLEKGLLTQENYDKLKERAKQEHEDAIKAIEERAKIESERITTERLKRDQEITGNGLRGILDEYRDAYDAISKLQSRQPQLMKSKPGEFGIESGLGAFGVVSISATKKNYKEALDAYKELSQNILQEKEALQEKFDRGEITFNDFQQAKRELDGLAQDTADAAIEVTENLKDVGGEFIRSIQQYIQFFGQGLQTIMQSLWSAEDVAFDKEQEAIDKENERLEKALEKNEEILERHSNNVNDIEDELSSARGDRRQHLIDQLNAETEAQREAAQEKKRIEKEQEALQRKQDALDKKRKEAQYKRDLANILVSGAMAAVNAYATKPFVPVGLTMGSLALALTAAQYAIAKSAKPYAHGGQLDGGVADGPRHSQGGIKVLGGRAEIEGGEFITNRTSTAKNIDLLEYVNSQKRKVDINDLIDFYSSGKPKKTVQSIRGRFAEGGNLPTLRTDIDINDRLVSAFEDYAKTPSVVQVVDIIDRTKKVNNVKVLAGLSE